MKKAGIILLILQAFAIFGGVVNGNLERLFAFDGLPAIFKLLGFFLPAIIGIILLLRAKKKAAK